MQALATAQHLQGTLRGGGCFLSAFSLLPGGEKRSRPAHGVRELSWDSGWVSSEANFCLLCGALSFSGQGKAMAPVADPSPPHRASSTM